MTTSLFALAGATLITACNEERDDTPLDGDGIAIEESGDTEPLPPDLPGGDGDDSGDGDGDDSGDDGGDDSGPSCESTTAIASNIPPNVILVLDKSRSMVNHKWDDDDNSDTPKVTRWHSLHATVAAITNQYQDGMKLGLTLFPSIDATSSYDSACVVSDQPEVAPALDNANAILASIPAADDLGLYGATPAAAGISTALAALESLGELPAAMILVTDGAANCDLSQPGDARFGVYDENLPLVVADAWDRAHIPTYVIGIDIESESISPATNPRMKLDEVAQVGGVALDGEVGFYDATDATALLAALDEIASAVSCTVKLDMEAASIDELTIVIGGQTIPRVDSCADGDGWVFTDPNGALDSIELCNGSCDALFDAGELEAEFPCPPQP
ncbi:hypothetical protein DB30_00504 [Enhygromyxa salina]|uniref:VWFA domain-containing protein n=1 Tax=Enhygromyxa salina TaxID=215803 RepID=A0A0C2CPK3_9BACT|nr:vWA domain-containing protein [Enhygromyxa salina]KIG13126.1 hypothetical protein DB30_00504 [Enhygromyxa salina]